MAKRKQPRKTKKFAPKRSKKPANKKRLSIRKSGGRRFQNEPKAYTEVTYYKIKGRRSETPKSLFTQKRFKDIQRATIIYRYKDNLDKTRYLSVAIASFEKDNLEKSINRIKSDYMIQGSKFKIQKIFVYRSIEGIIPEKQKRKKNEKTIRRQTKTHTSKTNKKKAKKGVRI